MNLSELKLDRYLYRDNSQDSETKDSTFVSADSSEQEATPIYSGGAAQDINTGNVQIDGGQLEPGTYPVTVLDVSNWGWGQTCAFESDTLNKIKWGAGDFISADGTTYSIDAGDTGVMTGKNYIYLSLLDSETEYQVTDTSSDSVGVGKVLIAVAENAADSATYNLQEATQIVGDNILANTIDASRIKAGTITATQISATYLYAGVLDAGQITTGSLAVSRTDADVTQTALTAGADIDNAKANGTTLITGGYISTGIISADNINTGSLSVSRTDAKCTDATANNTQTALTAGADISNAKANGTTLITGGYISTGIISADAIDAGTLSGRTVQTSSGTSRIKLVNDNIEFYSGNVLKATLDGTTAGNGGVRNTGDFILNNNKALWIADTTYSSTKYGGIGIDSSNKLVITTGTDNSIYIQNNAGTDMMYYKDGSQAIFYDGINCEGNFNVDDSYTARFEGIAVYFRNSTYTNARIQGSSTAMTYEAPSDHNFYVAGTVSVDAVIDANIWTNGNLMADGTKPFIIAHPDGTKDKLLRYTSQESPEVILRHRGKATTNKVSGEITIVLPEHFTLITDPAGEVTVNLTPIGNNHIFLQEEPTNSEIKVESDNTSVSFHYEVMAIRVGYLNAAVEIDAKDTSLNEKDRELVNKRKNRAKLEKIDLLKNNKK